jgi:hypothetical protein
VERAKGRVHRARILLVIMICALAVIATSAAASVSKAQAAAPSGPPCHSSFDPYHYTQAQVRACGFSTYPMSGVADLAGGGSAIEYKMNGRTVEELIPPPGFRPETATAAQLDEYGFPPRPSDRGQLARWQKEMSRWKGVAPPAPFLAQNHTRVIADTEYSNIWAGYVITAQPGSISAFSHAEGWYIEPTMASSRCSSTSEVSWAGLGGWVDPYNGGWLAQNGTGWGVPGLGAHQAWWEIVPINGITAVPNYYGTPGQEFDASTRVIDGGFRFWFLNYATGVSDAFDEPFTSSTNTLSAEVIIERPSVNKNPTNLANFQTFTVIQSEAWVNGFVNGTFFNNFPPNLNNGTGLWRHGVHMSNPNDGNDLADPSTVSTAGGFTVAQHNCN